MDVVLGVAFPVFAVIFCGYVAGRAGVLTREAARSITGFVYWFAVPALLFLAMAGAPLDRVFDGTFALAYLGSFVVTFLATLAIFALAFPQRLAGLTLAGVNAGFSNTVFMGLPLCLTAFGPEGALPAIVIALIQSVAVLGTGVVMIEADLAGGGRGALKGLLRTGRALSRNPVIVSPLLGLAWAASGLTLPVPAVRFAEFLGAAAAPAALFALGLNLVGQRVTAGWPEVGTLVLLKNLAKPVVFWLLATRVFDIDPLWAAAGVICAACPTGVNPYILASQYGLFVERSSSTILVSTALSVVTVSAILVVVVP